MSCIRDAVQIEWEAVPPKGQSHKRQIHLVAELRFLQEERKQMYEYCNNLL